MIKRIRVVLMLTDILTALSGCSIFEKNIQHEVITQSPETGIVVNNYSTGGHPIQLHFQKPPKRIVAVWQNSVETILALGAGDKIVAALGIPFTDCLKPEYREIYEKIPVKQFELLDTEHILMLEPDFILGWSSTFSEKTTKPTCFWHGRNINTYYAVNTMPGRKKRTIEDEYDYIMDIGTILDKKDKAQQIVDSMKAKIEYIKNVTEHRYHPRAIIMEQMRDNYTVYGENSLPGDILQHVNGELIPTG
ncbi:MAG: ABC transporter substrate-binding protein, partial [Anaerovibrio sp.]|nr:ABC transporter substrate-binding protein [Anaerovibrio sp.]